MQNNTPKFTVFYTWHGEQYRLLSDFASLDAAVQAVAQLKKEGFSAWVSSSAEPVEPGHEG